MDFIPSDVILASSSLSAIHLPLTCARSVPFPGWEMGGFAVPLESPVLPLLLLEPSLGAASSQVLLQGLVQEPRNPPAPKFLEWVKNTVFHVLRC